MQYTKSICLFAATTAMLFSCTKVINVKINDSSKKYVIEGVITDRAGDCQVKISQTKNFSESNTFPGISGATVTITDNSGATTTLSEAAQGTYIAPSLAGISGKTYSLRIQVAGQTFTATSTLPPKVSLDTLYMTRDNVFGSFFYLANIAIKDPAGPGNCYQCIESVNGKRLKQIFVTNDDYFDNNVIVSKLYLDPSVDDITIKAGDIISMDAMCIDPLIYKYWFSLQQGATGANQSAAPANPVTNISGGSLGYFSAQTIQTRTVVVE